MCFYLVQHLLHQIKAQQFYTDLDLHHACWVITENSKIQGLFKAFEWFYSTLQGRFNLQGLFKQALQIQKLFKPVWTRTTILT